MLGTSGLAALLDRFADVMDSRVPMPSSSSSSGPAVKVLFDMAVNKLLHFDQVSGVASWHVYYRLFWNDERLSYNGTAEFGAGWRPRQDFVHVGSDEIWVPDVVPFKSSHLSLESFGCMVYDDEFRQANGYNVLWTRPGEIAVDCDTNLQAFPFDSQQCTLIVGPWSDRTYSLRALHEGNTSNPFSGDHSSEEWEVMNTYMQSVTQTYINGVFEEVHYTMNFRRFPHYYLVNAVLPMSLVVILSTLTMWLPIEGGSGERLGFSVTLLLTIMATALFTAEFRPATREDTWLDRFQAGCICLTFFPVMESVFVVWLQFVYEKVRDSSHPEKSPPPDSPANAQSMRASSSSASAIEPYRRRGRLGSTFTKVAEFSTNLRSREVSVNVQEVMSASLRMRLVVWMMQKMPSLEWLITGRKGSEHLNPRSIDLCCRFLFVITALVAAMHMFSEIPVDTTTGQSVNVLLSPLYVGVTFYLLTALSALGFLTFRISVLCSDRLVAAAKAERRFLRETAALEMQQARSPANSRRSSLDEAVAHGAVDEAAVRDAEAASGVVVRDGEAADLEKQAVIIETNDIITM